MYGFLGFAVGWLRAAVLGAVTARSWLPATGTAGLLWAGFIVYGWWSAPEAIAATHPTEEAQEWMQDTTTNDTTSMDEAAG